MLFYQNNMFQWWDIRGKCVIKNRSIYIKYPLNKTYISKFSLTVYEKAFQWLWCNVIGIHQM